MSIKDKAREIFSPGRGKLNKLLADRDAVNQALAAVNARHDALRRQERELLAVANGPAGEDPLARYTAREKHAAMEPSFTAISIETNRLGDHRTQLDNLISPLTERVAFYRKNLQTALMPPSWAKVSLAARFKVWAEAAAALHGLIGIDLPHKMPEENPERAWLEYSELLGKALYPINRDRKTLNEITERPKQAS